MAQKYNIVYADPPWQYNDTKGSDPSMGGITYPTMTTDAICALPVSGLVTENAALFMWATWPMLDDGLRVMREWGFRYINCAFIWVKQNRGATAPQDDLFVPFPTAPFNLYCGLGHYSRGNTEPCLLGIKGRMERQDPNVRQVIIHPLMEHSRKPAETRDRIVQLFGDLPRVELFARQRTPGWDVWGNQVDSDLNLAA